MRIESDSLGPVSLAEDVLWGAQTERARTTGIARGTVPWRVIDALLLLKGLAARVNRDLGLLPAPVAAAIEHAAADLRQERAVQHFPLSPFQTGSGTSTNMNANEVIANLANERLGGSRGQKSPVHPNDHVNRCQSSNDVFPSAIHVAVALAIRDELLPAATALEETLGQKAVEFSAVVKLGRTHLMDALPVTLGQELGGFESQISAARSRVDAAGRNLFELALGGTAVGTGVNAHPEFADRVLEKLSAETGVPFVRAANSFAAQSARDACVHVSGALRGFAVSLAKVANDLRWMGSGPRGGLGELRLPALQPGSSIMPGKVNPVVPEAVLQACAQVLGDDVAVAQAGAWGGAFELHLMMPLIARNLIEEVELVSGSCRLLAERCVAGLEADEARCRRLAAASPALATPLAARIGYDAAARIVQTALREDASLIDAALEAGAGPEEELRELLAPDRLARPVRRESS